MAGYRQHIEAIINSDPSLGSSALERFLFLSSKCYGLAVRLKDIGLKRNWLSTHRLPCPVISIGNLTAGGTGKTPLTLYTARLLSKWGYRVAIVSRGYKGSLEKTGGVVSDGKRVRLSAKQAGDEPFMMATQLNNIPVLVGRNRFNSGLLAMESFGANVIILDDGFQHRKLDRRIDLLLVDHHRGFGNRHLLPRGPLREPLSALRRAHAVIETRAEPGCPLSSTIQQAAASYGSGMPVFRCEFRPMISQLIDGNAATSLEQKREKMPPLSTLSGMRVYGFSGLADNRKFHESLKALGCRVTGFQEFPDHHWYTDTDLASIQNDALRAKAATIVTTQKDMIRIHTETRWPVNVAVLGIEPHFGTDTDAFHKFIEQRMKTHCETP